MTFSKSILKKITTSDTKRPSSAQVIVKNPLDAKTILNGIELILSPEFSKKGKLIIEVNGINVFDEDDSEQFEGYAKYPIPLGIDFNRSRDIKIFAWNSEDSNTIQVSANMAISETQERFDSQAVPLGKDVFNQIVSEGVEIFPFQVYTNETQTELIDMEGYKKLIVTMSASTIPTITEELAPSQSAQGLV